MRQLSEVTFPLRGVRRLFTATSRWRAAGMDLVGLLLVIVLMSVIVTIIQPRFATLSNLENVARQASILAIVSSGQMIPILGGGFDLSVGSIVAATSVVTTLLVLQFGLVPGIVLGLAFASLLGCINGAIIAKFRVSAFVVTLGMLSFAHGFALFVTNGQPVFGLPEGFSYIGTAVWGVIPAPVAVAGLSFVIVGLLLARTTFGRSIYAVGGNEEAARLSGINVTRCKVFAFTLSGFFAGVASVVLSSRVNSGQPNLGGDLSLESIAAVVIGGVALGGGVGRVSGVVLGVAVIALLRNGLNLANVSPYVQLMLIGAVIIAAVVWDQVRSGGKRYLGA